jgi:hypothetical protein
MIVADRMTTPSSLVELLAALFGWTQKRREYYMLCNQGYNTELSQS